MKNLLLLSVLLMCCCNVDAQTIIDSLAGNNFCVGASFNVYFTVSSHFSGDNVFTAQLSDASGSFSNPVNIGSIAVPYGYLPVPVVIPLNTPTGSGYRIRVNGSDPAVNGSDNGFNITISNAATAPTLSISGSGCLGVDSLMLQGLNNGAQITWYQNGSPLAFNSLYYPAGTVAGGNGMGFAANQFASISALCLDDSGNIYVADESAGRVQKFPPGSNSSTNGITVAAGVPGSANQFFPDGVFVDHSGNLYVSDMLNGVVLKYPPGSNSSTSGIVVTQNGLYEPGSIFVDAGDNLYVATDGQVLEYPAGSDSTTTGIVIANGEGTFEDASGIFMDASGNLYISGGDNIIWKLSPGANPNDGEVAVAGDFQSGDYASQLSAPDAVYVDGSGNIYVSDENNSRVQRFPPSSTTGTAAITVAGGNDQGSAANQLDVPVGVFLDKAGNVYVADEQNARIQKWSVSATLNNNYHPPVAGYYYASYTETSGCVSPLSNTVFVTPSITASVIIDASQPLICATVTDTFTATPVNGGVNPSYQWYQNGLAKGIGSSVYTAAVNINDSIWAVMTGNQVCASPQMATSNHVHVTLPPAPSIALTGDGCLNDDTLTASGIINASQVNWYRNGSFVQTGSFADTYIPAGTVAGDNGPGSAANQFYNAAFIYVDANGFTYVADDYNFRIQKFPPGSDSTTAGVTVAGGNGSGYGYNQFEPNGVFVDKAGNIFVSDKANGRIMEFPPGGNSATDGIVVGERGLEFPAGLFVDSVDNVYAADIYENEVIEFPAGSNSTTMGTIVAGGIYQGSANDQLFDPEDVALDGSGNIYVSDNNNNRIMKFPPGSLEGAIGTPVGADQLRGPIGIYVDAGGYLYVADNGNNRILKFPPGSDSTTKGITVIVGDVGLDGAQSTGPTSVALDGEGNIYTNWSNFNAIIYVSGGSGEGGNDLVQKWILQENSFYRPADTGLYTAAYITGSCMSSTSDTVKVGLAATPSVTIALTAETQPACSQSPVTFTAYPGNGGLSPVYEFEINGFEVQNDSVPTLTTNNLYNGDSVTCVIISDLVCATKNTAVSNSIIVSRLPAIIPVITQPGSDTLATGLFNSYQWFNFGIPIYGADSQVLTGIQSGEYYVVVTDTNGCTDTSMGFFANQPKFNLFPNPTTGTFILVTTNSINQTFTVYDMSGNKVWQDIITADQQVVDLKGLTTGTYLVRVGNQVLRLVVSP